MNTYIPFLIAINQPLPHLKFLQNFVIEKGWRAAEYSPENDADWLVINSEVDDVWKPVTMEQIRELPAKLSLQRVSDRPRIVIIQALDLSHQSCQHALLKILEELPTNTIMLVSATNVHGILATVKSRCTVISIVAEQSSTKGQTFLTDLRAAARQPLSPAQVFTFSESWKDRAETLEALKAAVSILQTELETAPSSRLIRNVAALQKTYWELQANTNVRLQLETLANYFS